MRNSTRIFVAICALFAILNVSAQTKDLIEVVGVNFNSKLTTPRVVNPRIVSSSGGNTYWTAITIKFKVKDFAAKPTALDNGKWIDKASIVWRGLYKAKDGEYRRLEKTINYTDLTPGEYHATILIDPMTTKRYFVDEKSLARDLSLYAVFKVKGRTQLSSKVYIQNGKRQKKLSAPVTERAFTLEDLNLVDNILSSRIETPWRDSQVDHFPKIVKDK